MEKNFSLSTESGHLPAHFRIGFLGAGQLAKMSALKAYELGIQVAGYSDRADSEPMHHLCPNMFTGSFDDVDAMIDFAKTCDLITLENEFIDSNILQKVQTESGTPIYPSPESFAKIENKFIEKKTFEQAGIPVTPYKLIQSKEDLLSFGQEHGWPFILKSSKGGYDGYGNAKVDDINNAWDAFMSLGAKDNREVIAEAFIPFTHELAIQVASNGKEQVVYPCCETIQENHICTAVITPARISSDIQQKAQNYALMAMDALDTRGIVAFEFFLTKDGMLMLNESAPRPHNSGHYSIEGCITSQFENHVRAVLGLELGSTKLTKPAAVMINLLGTHTRDAVAEIPKSTLETEHAHLHMYGKLQSKIGRKMGHFTLLGEDTDKVFETALLLTDPIQI